MFNRNRRVGIVTLLAFGLLGAGQCSQWQIEPVAAGGVKVDLVTDTDLGLHLAYVAGSAVTGRSLVYGHRDSDSENWEYTTVLEGIGLNSKTSIAVGPDAIHVVFRMNVGTSTDLMHARRDREDESSPWIVELIDDQGVTGVSPSLAVAEDGALFVAYINSTGDAVMFAERLPGTPWQIYTNALDEDLGNAATHVSLALDPQEGIHIAYGVPFEGCRYVHRAPGDTLFTTPETVVFDSATSFDAAVSANSNIVAVSCGGREGNVRVAEKRHPSPAVWLVDHIGETYYPYAAIAVDSTGRIHVIYRQIGAAMQYAIKPTESMPYIVREPFLDNHAVTARLFVDAANGLHGTTYGIEGGAHIYLR